MKLKFSALKAFLLLGVTAAQGAVGATVTIPFFTIGGTSVSSSANFHFRVLGVGLPECTLGFMFVDQADDGAKVKIGNLMSAYSTGKRVSAVAELVDYYGDGRMFCKVVEFTVLD